MVREERNANADAGPQFNPGYREPPGQRIADLAGHSVGFVGAAAIQKHRELITAQPGQQVTGAKRPRQPFPDLDQQAVAGLVAQAVIDFLEAIQVKQQQRTAALAGAGYGGGGGQSLHTIIVECPPVKQPGQIIRPGQFAQQSVAESHRHGREDQGGAG